MSITRTLPRRKNPVFSGKFWYGVRGVAWVQTVFMQLPGHAHFPIGLCSFPGTITDVKKGGLASRKWAGNPRVMGSRGIRFCTRATPPMCCAGSCPGGLRPGISIRKRGVSCDSALVAGIRLSPARYFSSVYILQHHVKCPVCPESCIFHAFPKHLHEISDTRCPEAQSGAVQGPY